MVSISLPVHIWRLIADVLRDYCKSKDRCGTFLKQIQDALEKIEKAARKLSERL